MEETGVDPSIAELLQSAVHNLKGPASRLRLLVQLLGRSGIPFDEDSKALLRHIEDSAGAVGVVAEGLRSYVEVCARRVQREELALDALVAEAQANLRSEVESVDARITHEALPTIHADRFLTIWLFQELLANAIRFRGESPLQVHISAAKNGAGQWFVAVSDNGPGIEPELGERVFRPFKKLSAAGGAGMGLAICRKIVELHGGRMWAAPREGGAEFRFYVDGDTPCV